MRLRQFFYFFILAGSDISIFYSRGFILCTVNVDNYRTHIFFECFQNPVFLICYTGTLIRHMTNTAVQQSVRIVYVYHRPNVKRLFRLLVIFFFFPTGLVRLYIAGLRSCPDHWATFCGRGLPSVCFFVSWQQLDSNPRPGHSHVNVLPLLHFDPLYINK